MDSITLAITLLIIVCVIVLVLLLSRGVNLWYWKINDIVKNQQEQTELLHKQNKHLEKIFVQLGGRMDKNEQAQRPTAEQTQEEEANKEVEKLKLTLKPNEIIVRSLHNGRIEKMITSDWEEIEKN
jgi:hypothetical protein